MNKPTVIGKYRIKGIAYNCYYFEDVQYALAEKAANKIGSGYEVCRISADSKQQAKKRLEKCLNDKFGDGGLWEM
jgi:hypothetical protein